MKYLFVGGPWDGRREEVPKLFTCLRVRDVSPEGGNTPFSAHAYRLTHFWDDGGSYSVYLSEKEVPYGREMAALIAGYRQPARNVTE